MIDPITTKHPIDRTPDNIPIPFEINGSPIKLYGVIIQFVNYGSFSDLNSRVYVRRKWKIENYEFAEETIELYPEATALFVSFANIPYFVENASNCWLEVTKVYRRGNYNEPIYEINLLAVYDY